MAFDEQKTDVEPVPRELLAGERLGLRNFVFVVREDQVFATGVQIEARAKFFHRHHGAFDVPAGTSGTD